MSEKIKKVARGRAAAALTPNEIRRRDEVQINFRLRGEEKDTFADVFDSLLKSFNASPADVVIHLAKNYQQANTEA